MYLSVYLINLFIYVFYQIFIRYLLEIYLSKIYQVVFVRIFYNYDL